MAYVQVEGDVFDINWAVKFYFGEKDLSVALESLTSAMWTAYQHWRQEYLLALDEFRAHSRGARQMDNRLCEAINVVIKDRADKIDVHIKMRRRYHDLLHDLKALYDEIYATSENFSERDKQSARKLIQEAISRQLKDALDYYVNEPRD